MKLKSFYASETPSASGTVPNLIAEMALGKKLINRLEREPERAIAIIIEVPDTGWLDVVAEGLTSFMPKGIIETIEPGRRSAIVSSNEQCLDVLADGRSVIALTCDPTLISRDVRAAADVVITIEALDVRVLRTAIKAITGQRARGLTQSDIGRLGPVAVMAAIRNAKTSKEAIDRIRRTGNRMLCAPTTKAVPGLSQLPLVGEVAAWSRALSDDLGAVARGEIDMKSVRYGVLEGPPGTGKTLLAEAVAQESNWRFVTSSVSAWFSQSDGNLGGVTRAASDFFGEVMASDFSVGFLDEIQSIPDRARLEPRHREWWLPVIDNILLQIDRVRKSGRPVLLLGACNHYFMLDDALIRGGRLEQRITVRPPNTAAEAKNVLHYYCQSDVSDADLNAIARLIVGRAPATVEAGVEEARSIARRAERGLTRDDLITAFGLETAKSGLDLSIVARHEAAHAVIAHKLGARVHAVTVLAQGPAAGETSYGWGAAPMRRHGLEDRVRVLLAGRAADEQFSGGASAGALGDLAAASALLSRGRYELGLYDRLGVGASSDDPAETKWREERLGWLMGETRALVHAERVAILRLASVLMDKKVLDHAEIVALLGCAQ